MMSFWRVSAAALLALGLAVPMSEIASSAQAGPNMGGSSARIFGGGGGGGGPFAGAGPRMGGGPRVGSAPRSFNPGPSSGPKFSAPRSSAPHFNPSYKGNWSGKGSGGKNWNQGNWSGKGSGGKNWNHGNWNGKGSGGKNWNQGNWSGKGHHHHGNHRHYRRGFYGYALPYYYDDYYSYGDSSCAWMWQRWLETGNPKWKYRYYECIE